jgi:glycine dehydrogenase subunit 1
VYLGLAGRCGLRALAAHNVRAAHDVARRLHDAGMGPVFSAPFFNEFAIAEPGAPRWHEQALAAGVVPGVRLQRIAPDDVAARGRLLVTVTEMNTPEDVEALIGALCGEHRAQARA